ncbi:hypothetical protein AV654_06385 [Paenibacillus elgii]|uniref:Uncharacterized protein n=1 Tax=Paenibacillus elgii TaxID=189691 RepID=A0A161RYK6_9BACL|nr:hypothetical protein [Paenibacillus elgii]KZE70508.1 hypothetical protein AV654_06385 [Paenibacillus elgii]
MRNGTIRQKASRLYAKGIVSIMAAVSCMWMSVTYGISPVYALGTNFISQGQVIPTQQEKSEVIPNFENYPIVTVISVPGLSFMELQPEWLDRLPALRKLATTGRLAAMNVRVPYKGLESVYATWGAGTPADGKGGEGWNRAERRDGQSALALIRRFAADGAEAVASSVSVLVPAYPSLKRDNAEGNYLARPGLLGETLKRHGVRLGVWGNLDEPGGGTDRFKRPAPLMIMDGQGTVTAGDVGRGTLIADPAMPSAVRMDTERLVEEWRAFVAGRRARPAEGTDRGALAVMELGDWYRLYAEKAWYEPARFAERKRAVLEQTDRLLSRLTGEMEASGRRHVLWLVSPKVHSEAWIEKWQLTPVIRWSSAITEGTLMSSATTRRPGLVAAVDVAPSLLGEFGLSRPEGMTGLPIVSAESRRDSRSPLAVLLSDMQQMANVYALRPTLLYGLAGYEVSVMLLGLIALRWAKPTGRLRRWMRGLLFSVLLAPGVLLALGWAAHMSKPLLAGLALAAPLALGTLAAAGSREIPQLMRTLGWIGAGTGTLILLDGCTGAEAMKRSVLGYDPIVGARYYGIGNEFMGVLLGASLLGLSAWLQVRQMRPRLLKAGEEAIQLAMAAMQEVSTGGPGRARAAARRSAWREAAPAAAVGAAVAGCLAAPALGSEAGGALASAAAFGALAARLAAGGALRLRRLALAVALPLGAALAGLWLLNAAWLPGPAGEPSAAAAANAPVAAASPAAGSALAAPSSHIGRAFDDLRHGRYDVIGAIIARKLAMNVHLIRVSAWSKVLLTALAVMAVLVLRPSGRLRLWEQRYPYLMHGCYANVIGALAALALNDSGIVAAAAMIVYSSVPLLLLKLEGA